MLNVTQALLKLSQPFVNDPEKRKLINVGFIWNENAHLGVYSTSGDSKVDRLGGQEATESKPTTCSNEDFNFITQCFFLTARALNLGLFPLTNTHHQLTRQLGHMSYQIRARGGDVASDPQFGTVHSMQLCYEVLATDPDMLRDAVNFYAVVAETMLACDKASIQSMPEFFVDDICEILIYTTTEHGVSTDILKGVSLGSIFNLVILLLSPEHASTIRNYNLRARLGDILFNVFLPSDAKKEEMDERFHEDVPYIVCCDPTSGSPYLLSSKAAQETLAPSLLLLYGQVEHTGHYDRQGHRSRICSLLKYLWGSSEHRAAFAMIASNEASFVKFANGVLNETNELIVVMMEKLPLIKNTQEEMKSAAWASRTQEDQDQVTSRLQDNEREVKSALMLANKTMKMFAYLSTDAKIAELFQGKELSSRLVNVLLYVIQNMLGTKGLGLKVDNPESYYFKPKELLGDLVSILVCFVDSPSIHTSIAQCGYYTATLLPKLLRTSVKLGIIRTEDSRLPSLIAAVEAAKSGALDMDAILADAPDEFMDPLTFEVMVDPVLLPTSNNIIDRSSITQHLLNDPMDPFNRQPLSIDDVVSATELKNKIEAWKAQKIKESKESTT